LSTVLNQKGAIHILYLCRIKNSCLSVSVFIFYPNRSIRCENLGSIEHMILNMLLFSVIEAFRNSEYQIT